MNEMTVLGNENSLDISLRLSYTLALTVTNTVT